MFSKDTLEYNLILNQVSLNAYCDSAKMQILNSAILTDITKINYDLNFVWQIASVITRFGRFPFILDYDQDWLLDLIAKKQMLNVNSVLTLRLLIVMELNFSDYLTKIDSNHQMLIAKLSKLSVHDLIMKKINSIVNIDGEILDDASPNLKQIRNELTKKGLLLNKVLQTLLSKYGAYLNENLVTMRSDRYVIPVNQIHKNKVKGIVHDISASGQTVYIEPDDIRQVTAEIETLKKLETDEIALILEEFSKFVFNYHDTLRANLNLFIELDYYHAKAIYGNLITGVIPKINEAGIIELKNARHPLIDPKQVVAIDVAFDSKTKVILISGPNTGGKTVALKTVGLLTLMMQGGLLIPASSDSTLSIFSSIFADIGDEQSIEQSLSTFSSHLTKINRMINNLNDNQLILLDELGSGTDPQEGVALAIAILNKIRKYNIKALVTTHYSELKLYALEHDDVVNGSVAFDFATLRPLYKLQIGISGMSQALDIAARLGLNKEIIDDARSYIGTNKSNLSKMLERFNKDKYQLSVAIAKFNDENKKLLADKEDLIKEKEAFVSSQQQIINTVRETEEKKHKELQKKLKGLIKELEAKNSLTLPELSAIKHDANQVVSSEVVKDDEPLAVNDYVLVIPYNQSGYIKAIKKDKYSVLLGQFTLDFNKESLKKIQEPKKETVTKAKRGVAVTPSREASMELDLRGVRYEDVKNLLDHAIDRAVLANYNTLRIIHGFGTGAVRNAVYSYIKTSSQIASSRFGGEGEGLNGVTIITLK